MSERLRRRAAASAVAATAVLLALPAGAPAEPLTTSLEAGRAVERDCAARPALAAGVAMRTVAVDAPSMVEARLDGGGEWDLAVFDAAGRTVAASAHRGASEIAQGFATRSGELVVQACRLGGSDETAELTVETVRLGDARTAPPLKLVRVATPGSRGEDVLAALGLDLTEHGRPGFVDVVLHGPADAELLERAGFEWEVLSGDLAGESVARHTADRRFARRVASSALPSGATTYRRLFDYSAEMRALADAHPKLVRYFKLPFASFEGRPVEGIEVAPKVNRKDGRPVFLMMGAHHAREWPSSEHTIEFAYELINGWTGGDAGIRRLMRRARVIFVPVVNPDGFNTSREAGEAAGAGGGRGGVDETLNLVIPYEYHRKNCRFMPPDEAAGGSCSQPISTGLAQFGVDPNRNYGGFWGGPGATPPDSLPFGPLAQDYRGPGPFSEPETQNVRWLISRRQVTTMITNHTFSNLVLRPPGLQAQGPTPDEALYKQLGDTMAAENGYTSEPAYQLYDTSGTTEDWSYYATGGLGFTFEIGPTNFHPPFAEMVAEYTGEAEAAGGGGGNRAAFLDALASAARTAHHSLIAGRAPRRAFLTLKKSFDTPTSPVVDGAGNEGDVILLRDRLETVMRVSRSGRFRWHVNPSTRPLAEGTAEPPPSGEPSAPVDFSGGPGASAVPCADADAENETCFNDHPFTVPGGPGIDNGLADVRIEWATLASDWDMKVFRDTNADGSSVGETEPVGVSATGPSTSEEVTVARPGLAPGDYVVRVVNYAAVDPYTGSVTFEKTPAPVVPPGEERWKLVCRAKKNGPALAKRNVHVERGERRKLDLRRACRR